MAGIDGRGVTGMVGDWMRWIGICGVELGWTEVCQHR